MNEQPQNDANQSSDPKNAGIVTRRRALMMGAVTASAVISIKPALAQSAGSALNCSITVPTRSETRSRSVIDPVSQQVVSEEYSVSLPGGTYSGEQVRKGYVPTDHMNYIRGLKRGQSGFTCFASIVGRH